MCPYIFSENRFPIFVVVKNVQTMSNINCYNSIASSSVFFIQLSISSRQHVVIDRYHLGDETNFTVFDSAQPVLSFSYSRQTALAHKFPYKPSKYQLTGCIGVSYNIPNFISQHERDLERHPCVFCIGLFYPTERCVE